MRHVGMCTRKTKSATRPQQNSLLLSGSLQATCIMLHYFNMQVVCKCIACQLARAGEKNPDFKSELCDPKYPKYLLVLTCCLLVAHDVEVVRNGEPNMDEKPPTRNDRALRTNSHCGTRRRYGEGHNHLTYVPKMSATFRLQRGIRRRAEASSYQPQSAANDGRTQGTCSYYPVDATGCRAPRSCYDCLNTDLENEQEGCMINEIGRCVSVAGNYDVSLDFRVVSAEASDKSNGSFNTDGNKPPRSQHATFELEFPAINTTYCEHDDTLFNEDQLSFGGFTYGTGGCVFIEVCEIPSWAYVVGGSDCSGEISADYYDPSDDGHKEGQGDNPQGYLVFWCVAIAIILTLVATLVMVITIRHHHSKRRNEELRRRTIVVGEPITSASRSITPKPRKSGVQLLDLFGWEAMRADLIEKERQEMQNQLCVHACPIDNSVPGISPSANYLQLVGAQPSAPAMSPVVPSAPRLTDS